MLEPRSCILGVLSIIFAAATPLAVADFRIARETVVNGLILPVGVTAPPGDRDRLFVLEQRILEQGTWKGRIRIVDLNSRVILGEPFLTIAEMAACWEQGLLGLAFHPEYASNGLFYVNFDSATDGATHIRRYQVSADPNVALPGSGLTILTIARKTATHSAGWLGFGPDGYLYIASGDGSLDTDNAQDITDNLQGKILRIDVNGDDFPADPDRNYAIPLDNPFRGIEGDDEIWAYGLRNPWRCSFDRLNGDLYLGDVGLRSREEIDVQSAASSGGLNYGWPCFEGTRPHTGGCVGPVIAPIYEVVRDGRFSWSITGGYVYRGAAMPALHGKYFFGDFMGGSVWSFRFDGSQAINLVDHSGDLGGVDQLSSFGEDGAGELYVASRTGYVFKIVARFAQGDVNCSGQVDAFDIEPFLTALFDPAQYAIEFPDCDLAQADMNLDGSVNAFDIEPFLDILFP